MMGEILCMSCDIVLTHVVHFDHIPLSCLLAPQYGKTDLTQIQTLIPVIDGK